MSDDRILFMPGDHVAVGVTPHGNPMLAYLPSPDLGLAPGLRIGLEFWV